MAWIIFSRSTEIYCCNGLTRLCNVEHILLLFDRSRTCAISRERDSLGYDCPPDRSGQSFIRAKRFDGEREETTAHTSSRPVYRTQHTVPTTFNHSTNICQSSKSPFSRICSSVHSSVHFLESPLAIAAGWYSHPINPYKAQCFSTSESSITL